MADVIPPFVFGRTPPPGPQAAAEAAAALPLLDRVFPPHQSDPAVGDRWVVTGRSGLAYGAWSEPVAETVAS